MDSAITPEVRVSCCSHCGAPLALAVGASAAKCSFCGALSLWHDRTANAAPGAARGSAPRAEPERFARLRAQDPDDPIPPSLAGLIVGSVLNPLELTRAKEAWFGARAERQCGGGAGAAQRLYALTRLWHDYASVRNVEAPLLEGFVEAALDLAATRRQQQVLRGMLACDAAIAGQLGAAEQWLAPCDPESEDLASHSAHRLAIGLIATVKRDWRGVLAALGPRVGDVPLADCDLPLAVWLVAHAVESSGDVAGAEAELASAIDRMGRGAHRLVRAKRRADALDLCPVTGPALRGRLQGHVVELRSYWVEAAMGGILIAFGGAWLAWIAAADGDPNAVAGGLAVASIGLVVLAVALEGARRARRLRKHGVRVRGTIVALNTVAGSGDHAPGVAATVAVEWQEPFVVKRWWAAVQCERLEPGSRVRLLVDPKRPKRARIVGLERW
ncbi:MAG: DUF3592 domain-containing protein [Polyangiaceae bacterium]|nr:DUF3592 domain-containing protein [Polyangiaceae bacterium]